jgi:signal transduction histidine kinase
MIEHSQRVEPIRVGLVARAAISLFVLAEVVRTLTDENTQTHLPWYAGLMTIYVLLFAFGQWPTGPVQRFPHPYMVAQTILVVGLLAVDPQVDAVTGFFIPVAFQAPLFFTGRTLWLWVGALSFLTPGCLVLTHGLFQGLALGLSPLAGVIALPAYMVAHHEMKIAGEQAEALVDELQQANRRLKSFAEQVEELAALRERNRLARDLHDTVSQLIFGIALTARSAELLLQQNATQARDQLERLGELTSQALSQLRSFIAQMRP